MAASPTMEKLHKMVATSAIHDGERDEKDDYTRVCHPGTREEHLQNLQAWAGNPPPDTRVEWTNAIAGAGKTAMFRTFSAELEEQTGVPSISFFVWKGDNRRNTLKLFPATITYQLSRRIPAILPRIEKAINEDPLLLQSAFKKQMEKLVIRPLLDCCNDVKSERHLIIVVDGLDELDPSGQTEFLDFIPYLVGRLSSLPISLLLSSRPDPQIVGAFNHPKLASITRATRLGASDADIRKFLEDKFDEINLRHPYLQIEYGGMWPSREKREIMVRQSSGLFIWPTVAIGHIDKVEKGLAHNARLEQVLSSAEPKPWVASPLDNLYRAILEAHAPEDRTSYAFLRFKRRLALLCIIDLGKFVGSSQNQVVDWSDAPVRFIFGETLDELWGSIAGLSSLFSPRQPLTSEKSPTPGISHRSLRDFTFNKERCGEHLYYSTERELHTEVVCKVVEFFNTQQAYQNCTEMGGQFICRTGDLLASHLEKAVLSGKLGCCMDDITLSYIPPTWPLVTQILVIIRLSGSLYRVAENPDFPEGSQRREAMLGKVTAFIKIRAKSADTWDIALFRLAQYSGDFRYDFNLFNHHSVDCWHVGRSPQCACVEARVRYLLLGSYLEEFRHTRHTTLFQDTMNRLVEHRQVDIAQHSRDVLQFIISVPETSQRATELMPFIPVSEYWITDLLEHCPPTQDLYNALGPICTPTLSDLSKEEVGERWSLVQQVLIQTNTFNKYAERCREVGIDTHFPFIKIPEDWWEDEYARGHLFKFEHKPSFEIPEDWWGNKWTMRNLLFHGYKPSFEIPKAWWEDEEALCELLKLGYDPPFDIPGEWWRMSWIRRVLRRRGYPPPDPYSAEDTASEGEDEQSTAQEEDTEQQASQQDEPLTGGEALSEVTSPSASPPPPVASLSDPPGTGPTAPADPTSTPAAGLENAGSRRRGFRKTLKSLFRR